MICRLTINDFKDVVENNYHHMNKSFVAANGAGSMQFMVLIFDDRAVNGEKFECPSCTTII